MYEKMRQDHVDLLGITREIRAFIDQPENADPVRLSTLRWQFARMVTQHLAVEDIHIYGRLAHDPRPEAVAISRRFERELGTLLGAFNAHIAHWSADAVRNDWINYCGAMRALLDALETRIACEEKELYPLLVNDNRQAA